MFFSRRNVVSRGVQLLLALGLSGAVLAPAQAQSGTPIRLLVGFPAGAGSDAIARTLGEKLKDVLGVPVVVENRAGAGGQIAATVLKSSPADGHTLFLSHDHTISILPQVVKNPGFNPATDFVPVAGFATFANVLAVSGGTPAKSIDEYVKWVRTQKGGKETIGIPAPASIPEFLVKMISEKYKIDVQPAPYRRQAGQPDHRGHRLGAGLQREPQGGQGAHRGLDRRQAPGGDSERADLHRAGLCEPGRPALLRHLRAGGHAAADHRQVR